MELDEPKGLSNPNYSVNPQADPAITREILPFSLKMQLLQKECCQNRITCVKQKVSLQQTALTGPLKANTAALNAKNTLEG